jgi:hypothetical protein
VRSSKSIGGGGVGGGEFCGRWEGDSPGEKNSGLARRGDGGGELAENKSARASAIVQELCSVVVDVIDTTRSSTSTRETLIIEFIFAWTRRVIFVWFRLGTSLYV